MNIVKNQNGLEFDVDALITDVNGKAEIDFTNISNLGKSRGASWAMPSDTCDVLVSGTSGTSYVAPASGYFSAESVGLGNTSWLTLTNVNGHFRSLCVAVGAGQGMAAFIPCSEGDSVILGYNNLNSVSVYFTYVNGSESEA